MKPEKTEEIIAEELFLAGNEKWGGKVQVLRVTVQQGDGTTRSFINKRLVFTSTGRYNNLPRKGCEEIVEAIKKASVAENAAHEALLTEINARPRNTTLLSQSSRRSRS